jgi:hypothetical protein
MTRIIISRDTETHEYRLARAKKDGGEGPAEIIPPIEAMNITDACKALLGFAKEKQTLREAAVTIQAEILKEFTERLAGFKGTADKRAGIPKELKDAFRDCETDFFKRFLDSKHPAHKQFVNNLPKMNDRGQALEVMGKPNIEAQFQYFMSVTRAEGNYANAKNMVLSAYAYCGVEPLNDDGQLIPPEVLAAYVRNAREEGGQGTRDNSYKQRLYTLFDELVSQDGWKKEPTDNWPELKRTINELAAWVNQYADIAAKKKTEEGTKPDAAQQTRDAMAQANQKAPANGPTEAAKKAPVNA